MQLVCGSLPLAEVVIRLSYGSPFNLDLNFLNGIHQMLKETFPEATISDQIELPPGLTVSIPAPFGVNGFVLSNPQTGLKISFGQHLISARWVAATVAGGPAYPGFSALKDSIRTVIDALRALKGGEPEKVSVVNMSYVDLIEASSSLDVLNYLRADCFTPPHVNELEDVYHVEHSWKEGSIDMRVQIISGSGIIDGKEVSGLKLQTVAGKLLPEPFEYSDELDRAHECLQHLFWNITSQKAKDKWEITQRC